MNDTADTSEPRRADERDERLEQRFQFRRVNEITGTFVLLIVAVLIAAVAWTGHSQRWFKSTVPLRIVLPAAGAAGIRHGSEVYFLGTLVGSVSDVIVDSAGRMEAQINIRHDFFRFVRADSSALVKRKFGVAGDSFFEITRGEGQPLPEKNASIVCNEQFQNALESAIEEVSREAVHVLKKTSVGLDTWTQLGADLGETRKRLDLLTAEGENIAASISAGNGTVGKLISDPALIDEAVSLLTRANAVMSQWQEMMTNLNAAVQNVEQGTARLPEITEVMANESRDLPGLIQQTQSSMREMERLIEAMQGHWLFRKAFAPRSETVPPKKPFENFVSPKGAPR